MMSRIRFRLVALVAAAVLTSTLNACVVVTPWRMLWGGWQEGIPHDPLIFKKLPEPKARQAAAAALVGLREKPYRLKDVRVLPGPATNSVLLMGSLPFNPPEPPKEFEEDVPANYRSAVFPVFVKVTWHEGSLTHFDVHARIIRTPFRAGWSDAYDATGSADATPAYLLQRASDMRTRDQIRQMDAELDRLNETLANHVRADLPWVVEEVSK